MTAKIKGDGKAARDIQKTVGEPRGTFSDQKIGAREIRHGAFATPLHELSIENLHTVSHGAFYATLVRFSKAGDEGMGALTRWTEISLATGRLLLNAVLPPQCLACRTVVDTPGHLCGTCFSRFTFITPPHCGICGLPLDQAVTEDLMCGPCVVERPSYGRARAAFVYDAHSRPLVLKLKHGDRTDMAAHLAKWLARAGSEVIEGADVIVPVPLHRWRLLMRAYNQSALLARALGRLAGKPVVADAITRTKATVSQGGLSRAERRRNVARAFSVHRPTAIDGKRVLLIDDVLTSGATVNACALALIHDGAKSVDVLALARVPNPADAP